MQNTLFLPFSAGNVVDEFVLNYICLEQIIFVVSRPDTGHKATETILRRFLRVPADDPTFCVPVV